MAYMCVLKFTGTQRNTNIYVAYLYIVWYSESDVGGYKYMHIDSNTVHCTYIEMNCENLTLSASISLI